MVINESKNETPHLFKIIRLLPGEHKWGPRDSWLSSKGVEWGGGGNLRRLCPAECGTSRTACFQCAFWSWVPSSILLRLNIYQCHNVLNQQSQQPWAETSETLN